MGRNVVGGGGGSSRHDDRDVHGKDGLRFSRGARGRPVGLAASRSLRPS